MISEKWMLTISSIVVILIHHLSFVAAQSVCAANDTLMSNSLYQANINSLLPSLSANVDSTAGLFYNTSAGLLPNRVYGAALCRADLLPSQCRWCIQNASIESVQSCPNAKQVIRWKEFCMLRYSNESLFGIMSTFPNWFWWSIANATSPVQFKTDLRTLLDKIRVQAPVGGGLRKVAWGNISTSDFLMIFALVQCTPDLSADDCSRCLVAAVGYIRTYCDGKTLCRVLLPTCILYYSTHPFYNETRLNELMFTPAPTAIPPAPQGVPPAPPVRGLQPPPPSQPLPPPPQPLTTPPTGKKDSSRTIIIAAVVGVVMISLICVAGVVCRKKRKKRPRDQQGDQYGVGAAATTRSPHEKEMSEPLHKMNTAETLQYDFGEVKAATDGFSNSNKLGQGGFGAVFWGRLSNGQEIAVKKLALDSIQGDVEFKNEVLLVAKLQHRNLVKLLGFSIQGNEKLLLYEFVENLSLDRFIFDRSKRAQLGWERRSNIIMGVAKGLLYLHEDSRVKIVHRDLKSSNILLDREMNPKIADFGLARLFMSDATKSANTTRIVGTYGYMAPEYAMHGWFSFKSDVFSFGVLVLEIVSGQKNNTVRDGVNVNILSTAWRCWNQEKISDMTDPVLNADWNNLNDIQRCIHVALLCVQENAEARPTMANVVQMLGSSSISLPLPLMPPASVPGGGYESEYSMGQERIDPSAHDLFPR